MSESIPETPLDPSAPLVAPEPVAAAVPVEPVAAVEPIATEPAVAAAVEPVAPPAVPEPVPIVAHTDTPTLMQQAGKPEPVAVVAEPVAPAEPTAPIYEPFTLPEGLTVESEKLTGYTSVLGKHNIPQAAGQELLDLYIAERQRDAVNTLAYQHQAFADTRADWRAQVMKDPEIGGNNHNTAMANVAYVRNMVIPKSGPITEAFDKALADTGIGDHPEFLRAWARIGAKLREPAPPRVTEIKPPPDIGRRPGRSNGAAIYDNPTSPQPRANI